MIVLGKPLLQFDLVAAYCVKNDCAALYMDFHKYNSLDTTKKATVTTYYEGIVDDYVLDVIKAGVNENTISFATDEHAGVNAESWFPKLAQCPDADHYINAYVVDNKGDITWQNV